MSTVPEFRTGVLMKSRYVATLLVVVRCTYHFRRTWHEVPEFDLSDDDLEDFVFFCAGGGGGGRGGGGSSALPVGTPLSSFLQ